MALTTRHNQSPETTVSRLSSQLEENDNGHICMVKKGMGSSFMLPDAETTSLQSEPDVYLKSRLGQGSTTLQCNDAEEDGTGSEYEMLLDMNPTVASHRTLGILSDEDAMMENEANSPYPEVRAAVRNYDEDLPCNTVRAWAIGLLLVCMGASMNTLFSLRQPSIGLGALIAQILAWPMGHSWAKVMPKRQFKTFGLMWSLNPGPFNIKEHSIIVVMASVSFSVAYATDVILAQLIFYKQNFGIIFQIMLVISTQSLGYGIAGIMRKFLGTVLSSLPFFPFILVARHVL